MNESTQGYSCTGRAYVLDAGALLAGVHLSSICRSYTTSLVAKEIKDEGSKLSLERALVSQKLEILDPPIDEDFKALISRGLSLPDISIIVLAEHLKKQKLEPVVFTDDYLLQEVLLSRGFEVRPVRYKGSKSYKKKTKGNEAQSSS
ncbi:MAG: hypothetical protein QXN05_01200 [Acidilobaceae archaeon]